MTNDQKAIKLHEDNRGKIEVSGKVPLETHADLALAYTPGVAAACLEIAKDSSRGYDLTTKGNTVAVVTDGSAVLGLGDIGPLAALPVMEGKAAIFKRFGGVDAFPICLDTQDTEEIITAVKAIAPGFGGINLEDIAAPRCFEIEERLQAELDIPVMHDDQHGTAIVVLAGLINAVSLAGKDLNDCHIVVNGVGSAGVAIMNLVKAYAPSVKITALDSKGIINQARKDLNPTKQGLLDDDIIQGEKSGDLMVAMQDSDIFLGVSKGNVLNAAHVGLMNDKSIVFAMANPDPEILPEAAKEAGVYIMATGRSDFPNQINNSLVFPGLFAGMLEGQKEKKTQFSRKIYIAAAKAVAARVENPTLEIIIPDPFDESVPEAIMQAVKESL